MTKHRRSRTNWATLRPESASSCAYSRIRVRTVIKAQLKAFIRSRTLAVSLPEEPSDHLIESLRQSDEDIEAGRTISFKKPDEAIAYVQKLIDDDNKRHSTD